MADYSTFGVVAADLSRYVHRLQFDADTSPTLTQAGEVIAERAAEWCAFLHSIGVDWESVAADATSQGYLMSRGWIGRAAAIDMHRAKGITNTELAIALAEERDRLRDTMRDRVAEMGSARAASISAPNAPHTDIERATQVTAAQATRGIGARMANSGSV